MHDCFGDLVRDRFAYNVEVRRDQAADELRFEGFSLCEFGVLDGGWGLYMW